MKIRNYLSFTFLLAFLVGCSSMRSTPTREHVASIATDTTEEPLVIDRVIEDPIEIMPDSEFADIPNKLPLYRETTLRTWDLLHTRLDLSFDWPNQSVIGKAQLTARPLFYPSNSFELDAVNFKINKIQNLGDSKDLKWDYDGQKLKVDLGRTITRNDSVRILIDYVAMPNESEKGGSQAIQSDKGLFFINPMGTEDKPMQIWSQGETENNSKWFPTIDKPNERCTQEMYLLVDDKFKTISNGLLISSVKQANGMRLDYWKMDQPHAPYLFMIAVGSFAKVTEKYNSIDVDYYVEPEYAADATSIFANTPEMIGFFSNKLNYPFPWKKYAQVVVRDYVSGAMENTTATILGQYVQRHKRELIDEGNEDVVSHELFHQWFGDLVTTESWSNLTLNEGFANYSEYLWKEYKHGREEADFHRLNDLQGYLASAQQQGVHDLIDFEYADKENMFDAHSYNKGGLVLHMLRKMVGDDAFYASLNYYLNQHKYQSVEAQDLRLAFEAVTGQDLNWFFNQWFYSSGHPKLDIQTDYDANSKILSVDIEQSQVPEHNTPAIFRIPTELAIVMQNGVVMRKSIELNERKQTFQFDLDNAPKLVIFDPEKNILAEVNQAFTAQEYIQLYHSAASVTDRIAAIQAIENLQDADNLKTIQLALKDRFWLVRGNALEKLSGELVPNFKAMTLSMAKSDPNSAVRFRAISKLNAEPDATQMPFLKQVVFNEKEAYYVSAEALHGISTLNADTAIVICKQLEDINNPDLVEVISEIYSTSGNPAHLAYLNKRIDESEGYSSLSLYSKLLTLAKKSPKVEGTAAILNLKSIALNQNDDTWKRLGAAKTISELKLFYQSQLGESTEQTRIQDSISKLQAALMEIKSKETNKQLQGIYNSF
ncbi:MAG: DUF3458 domain-containing protein [Saprospiraceae bacterium]